MNGQLYPSPPAGPVTTQSPSPGARKGAAAATERPEPWVAVKDAAAYLGVKVSYLYASGDQLGIPVARVGRARRYKLSQLDAWMESRA